MIETEYSKRPYTIWFLTGQVLDILSTVIGILVFGFAEINPVMNSLPLLGILTFKIVVVIIATLIFIYWKRFPSWAYITVIVITFIPVIINIFQIVLTTIKEAL